MLIKLNVMNVSKNQEVCVFVHMLCVHVVFSCLLFE